jgi:integrase
VTTTTATTKVAVVDPVFSDAERYALAAFLAGYRGLTREAYALDLRQFIAWCHEHNLRVFDVRRPDIECFARDLEARGRARATVARRLCTVAGFYRYAEQEGLLARSPAAHVRRPRLDYESHATGLDPTRSAHSSSPPALRRRASTPSSHCWPSTGCELPRRSAPRSRRSVSNAATARSQ